MVDSSVRIISTAETCMLLDQHKCFVGCDLKSDVLSAARSHLLLTFAPHVVSPISDIIEDEEVRAEAQGFMKMGRCFWLAEERVPGGATRAERDAGSAVETFAVSSHAVSGL